MIVKANGVDIFVEIEGEGAPLLFLHGNGEDGRIFDRAAKLLSDSFTVVRMDSRSHGYSGFAPLSFEEMSVDTACIIRALHLYRPVVIGFSDGGIIALHLAANEPELLGGAVIMGANLKFNGLCGDAANEMREQYKLAPGDPYLKLMLEQKEIPLSALSKIKIPVVVAAGEHDIVKRAHTEEIAKALPKGRLIIVEGEDHSSYVFDNQKLVPLLRNALNYFK